MAKHCKLLDTKVAVHRAVASHFCAQGELMNFAPPPRAYGEISFGARLAGIFGDLFLARRPTSKIYVQKNFDDLFFFFLVTFHIFFHTPPTTPPTLHSPVYTPGGAPPSPPGAPPPRPAPRAAALVAPPPSCASGCTICKKATNWNIKSDALCQ
jgi:hypothetical protein